MTQENTRMEEMIETYFSHKPDELEQAREVPGLLEHLADTYRPMTIVGWRFSYSLSDIDIEGDTAAFIIDIHRWDTAGHSGIGGEIYVGVYSDEKFGHTISMLYRDTESADYDRDEYWLEKVRILAKDTDEVLVEARSARYQSRTNIRLDNTTEQNMGTPTHR